MYYELYADSLWMLNFVMNLYLLILVDRSLLRTATRGRLILGAAAGACLYLLPFLWDAPALLKYLTGIMVGTAVMIAIAFRPESIRAFVKILGQLFLYSFLAGGLLLFLTGSVPFLREKMFGVSGILGLGAMGFLGMTYLQDRRRIEKKNSSCRAVLGRNGKRVCVTALIDSGNSLVEPVSGKPVSIIDQKLYQGLWSGEEVPYRVIPYRSIGKKRGILQGYLLPELKIEMDGIVKQFQNVYVAVGGEYGGGMGMILNPALLEETAEGRRARGGGSELGRMKWKTENRAEK